MAEVISADLSGVEEQVLLAAASCPTCNIRVEQDGVAVEQSFAGAAVVGVERLCPDVVELMLGTGVDEFVPGQYVTFALSDRKGKFYRAYSIVSATPDRLTFCIKLDPKGRAGKVLARLRTGDELRISSPKGTFALRESDCRNGDRSCTFIATGTGIAPILPMIRSIPDVPKCVLFGVRHERDLFYAAELADVPNTDVRVTLTRPGPAWEGHGGRVTDHIEALDLAPEDGVYLCGSPDMVTEVTETLHGRGHSPDAIMSERYSSSAPGAPGAGVGLSTWQALGLLVRRVHLYASVPLMVLFIFYAVTGFIGNRIDLFVRGDAGYESAATAPEELVLPAALPLTAEAVLPWLAQRYGGNIDGEHAEEDEEMLICDSESVWGTRTFTVDKPSRTYTVESRRAPWAGALVNLHRGKHTDWRQKLIADAAALVLVLVSVTGIVMVGQTRGRPRQRVVLCALGVVSLLLLAAFLVNR